ncbi:fimbria major subunit [uncultured Duncaniella sp.]|uniref:fimbria major subunit n=1 Tax=uncultured Duncaniella sp. TaxID=2768039 RepID=UPI002729C3CC|nr:fimbria major subunit [uncultured Duncaniella sp.]
MKTFKLFAGAAALLAMGALSACSSDEPIVDNGGGNQVAEKDESLYLRVALSNPHNGSRAVDGPFENGDPSESGVGAVYFKFFDINGNPVAQETGTTTEFIKQDEGSSVSHIKEAIVSISLKKGEHYPSYVMCFINPVDYSGVASSSTTKMNEYRNEKRDDYKNVNGEFAMSNSAYYGNDAASGAKDVKITAAAITSEQLFTSKPAADAATPTQIVDIYVERYASKVNFTLADNAVKDYVIDGSDYTLTFEPQAWTVNADAPQMYAIKRFASSADETADIPSKSDVQTMLGTWTQWNAPDLRRSYWGCSPSFYATEFPIVSDNIVDKNNANNGWGAGITNENTPYALKYYSYNQITDKAEPIYVGKEVANGGATNSKYVLENTMGEDAFKSVNPKAAAPSLLMVGKYTIKYNGTPLAPNTSFYLYDGDKIFFNENVTGAAPDQNTIKKKMIDEQRVLAVDDKGTKLNVDNSVAVAGNFDVKHPSAAVRGNYNLPHRMVTLQLTSVPAGGLFYKPAGSGSWVAVTEDMLNNINTILAAQLGYAEAYTNGLCYFSMPIHHLGISENTTDSPITDSGLDWSKVRVGDLGLVRNHVYDLQVSTIQGRATGIENPAYPIVPPMEEDNYYIKYHINILAWRIVPAQGGIIL